MKKSKLLLLPLILLLVVAVLAVSCGTGPTTTSTTPTTTSPTTTQPNTTTSTTSTTAPITTTTAPETTTTTGNIITGGSIVMSGTQLPKNIGWQPTMTLIDKVGLLPAIAERLMDVDAQGNLVPQLATSVDTNPAAKTITFHIRQGVTFHDGTTLDAAAVAWNFKQLKDAGVLQYGDALNGFSIMDPYTIQFNLKNFSYQYFQSFAYNVFIFSPTAIEINGKDWAITHVYGTGPFMLKTFNSASEVTVVKNPNYWQPGKPYLDAITLRFNLDSAVLSAAMQSNEIQMNISGDLTMQKTLISKGYKLVSPMPNQVATFMVPSSNDPNSPLSNELVREAIEYAIDRNAISQGLLQGNVTAMNQMSYPGAVGYDSNLGRSYDPTKAKELLAQAGYPDGAGISISIYGSNSAPSVARRTAIAGYLQVVGITAKVEALPFATYSTLQSTGWKNGLMDCVENSGAIWTTGYLSWLGPQPTTNPIPSLARPADYNTLANQILSAPDATTQNGIITQLIKYAYDNAMVLPLWSQPGIWTAQPFVHAEATGSTITFDWASLWMEAH
jgi:peptide/nickel transport system substrate-binding protein